MMRELASIELVRDERTGEGGHLALRRLRVRLVFRDGTKTKEGSWDFVERAMGLDAVVVAIWRRRAQAVEVLLRAGVRVPLHFGRPEKPQSMVFPELVAGIVEPGDVLEERAADEAREEAGLAVTGLVRLGPPMFPTPGMCAEMFHFVAAEVAPDAAMEPAGGDGSVFEEGARLEWLTLDEALRRCGSGEIQDLKTEVGLRRLKDALGAT